MPEHWDESLARVSRAFDEWKLIDSDQGTFLRLGLAFSTAEYDRLWKVSGREPYYDGGPDHLESFEDKVGGLHQHDFDWMHLSGVLRDSVTNFEIYLEKAREEVLEHNGQQTPLSAKSPKWHSLKNFFDQLDVQIESDGVRQVRDLRHFLTHRRGELRTEELRRQFQTTSDLIPPWTVELSQERVVGSTDLLAQAARSIDPAVYEYSWGGKRLAGLRP